jgi:hypothetical protein
MAVGTPLPANELKISVATEAAPTVFMPVSLMNRFEISGEENTAEFDTFDSDDPITFAGKRRRTLTVSGYLADGDSGQDALFAAAAAKETVILKFLWDGTTNGFTQECRVRAYSGSAAAGNQPVECSFDFTPTTAVGTIAGTGPLL